MKNGFCVIGKFVGAVMLICVGFYALDVPSDFPKWRMVAAIAAFYFTFVILHSPPSERH